MDRAACVHLLSAAGTLLESPMEGHGYLSRSLAVSSSSTLFDSID